MIFRILGALVAPALALAFYAIPIIKLKDPALIVVVLLGVVPMFVDLVAKLREKGRREAP